MFALTAKLIHVCGGDKFKKSEADLSLGQPKWHASLPHSSYFALCQAFQFLEGFPSNFEEPASFAPLPSSSCALDLRHDKLHLKSRSEV